MTIWDCWTHVPMTSSVEQTDLDFKISVALLYTIYMFCIVNIVGPTVCDAIAADIILSRVMIKPDYDVRE